MENIYDLRYPDEPNMFGANEIEPFMIWSTQQKTSDVTIQNEDRIVCEIHGKKVRVTNRKLSRSELINIVGSIYKSDGAISKLNSGEDVDLPWNIKVSRDETMRFRVNMTAIFTEGHKGYSITIRTINSRAPALESLNLPQEIVDNISPREGLIVIVGATGSGKSTLLASVLDWRMRKPDANLKIVTYEAPIEYVYDDVPKPTSIISQTEIGTHLPTFAAGVRNALRRKPDIILMGELRDKETIGEGVTASMTGHLVYGTLHATGVSTAVRRMVNVFDAEEKNARALDILSSLKMVIAQKLLPSTNGERVAIREYLVFTEEIVSELLQGGIEELSYNTEQMVKKHGQSFLQDAQAKFDEGLISQESLNEIIKLKQGVKQDIIDSLKEIENNKLIINVDGEESLELIKSKKWEDL
jgi:defect-in-organelle-trafficking protein DotB